MTSKTDWKELLSSKYALIKQFSFVEGVMIGLYVACILVGIEIIEMFFIIYPSLMIIKLNDGTKLSYQILLNKAFILLFITAIFGLLYQKHLMKRNKKIKKDKKNDNKNKQFWQRLLHSEDRRVFGELFMIIGGFFIVKWLSDIVHDFAGKEWLYFAFGFIFILWSIKLIRKSENAR